MNSAYAYIIVYMMILTTWTDRYIEWMEDLKLDGETEKIWALLNIQVGRVSSESLQ